MFSELFKGKDGNLVINESHDLQLNNDAIDSGVIIIKYHKPYEKLMLSKSKQPRWVMVYVN